MENSFGIFLKQKRQEKNITQKDLAKMLIVSESAVSKWERDVAHPDITLLPKLAEILGVTEHELITASIDNKQREENVQAKKWRTFTLSWSLFFYISYGMAILTCFICNLAVNKTLSWFWIVFSALVLSFTFTNLPKYIKKLKLIFIPLSMFCSLIILLAVCCGYTNGNWFWIASLSVLLGLVIIFVPIYIAKYKIFSKINKYNDFISLFIDFIFLNILLIVIESYTQIDWYFTIALPIVVIIYLILNLFFSIRFLKINRLLKTSIILFLLDIFCYIVPLFIKTDNASIKKELNDLNIFKADFSYWKLDVTLEQNIHLLIFSIIIGVSLIFLISGLIVYFKRKREAKTIKK